MNQAIFDEICNREVITVEDALNAKAWATAVVKCYQVPSNDDKVGYIAMSKYMEKNDMARYFWAISKCNCCERHMMARPVAVDSDEITPSSPRPHGCECLCRNHMRWLNRAYKLAN